MKKFLAISAIVLFSAVQAQAAIKLGVFCKAERQAYFPKTPSVVLETLSFKSNTYSTKPYTPASSVISNVYGYTPAKMFSMTRYSIEKYGDLSECVIMPIND